LPMTCRTIRQMVSMDEILANKGQALGLLIWGWRPTHIEYRSAGPDIILRVTMALQTPTHRQRFLLAHKRHLIDTAMAGAAAHTFRHVNAMVEEHIIG
ncbi:MAG TPA: hypothetical protein VHV26_01805, partial [Rhizomicrobium sp.]|nr:hypothetical protein [Rhizomicrobium sp.]